MKQGVIISDPQAVRRETMELFTEWYNKANSPQLRCGIVFIACIVFERFWPEQYIKIVILLFEPSFYERMIPVYKIARQNKQVYNTLKPIFSAVWYEYNSSPLDKKIIRECIQKFFKDSPVVHQCFPYLKTV